MLVTVLLVNDHKAMLGVDMTPSKREDDEWVDLDVRAKSTIILCFSYEVLYNVKNKETIAGLWCKLESLYMTKSFSNKLFLKKQLYTLRMKGGTPVLQHLNAFSRILRDLLALEVKLEDEDKAFLLSSLLSSYEHLTTTIIYGKEIFKVGRCQADAPEQRAFEEDRFHRGCLRIGSQGADGQITE